MHDVMHDTYFCREEFHSNFAKRYFRLAQNSLAHFVVVAVRNLVKKIL